MNDRGQDRAPIRSKRGSLVARAALALSLSLAALGGPAPRVSRAQEVGPVHTSTTACEIDPATNTVITTINLNPKSIPAEGLYVEALLMAGERPVISSGSTYVVGDEREGIRDGKIPISNGTIPIFRGSVNYPAEGNESRTLTHVVVGARSGGSGYLDLLTPQDSEAVKRLYLCDPNPDSHSGSYFWEGHPQFVGQE